MIMHKPSLSMVQSPCPAIRQIQPRPRQQGFTLLEVMVALAILAVVAVAASQASRSYIQSVGNMKTRSQAYFVAQNTLADLRINGKWLTSPDVRQVEENGARWQVTVTPINDTATGTNVDSLKKISIAVAPISDSASNSNSQSNANPANTSLVTIDAVLAKPELLAGTLSNSGGI